jgi:hypothetical protein
LGVEVLVLELGRQRKIQSSMRWEQGLKRRSIRNVLQGLISVVKMRIFGGVMSGQKRARTVRKEDIEKTVGRIGVDNEGALLRASQRVEEEAVAHLA